MKKKSEAQIFLEQVEKLDSMITNKLIEKQQWKDITLSITSNTGGERVRSPGAKSKMADAVERLVDLETEIDSCIDNLIDTKREVIQTIERLDSPIEYSIIHKRYVQFKPLQEIADECKKSYDWATTVHGRALKNVQAILNEQKR